MYPNQTWGIKGAGSYSEGIQKDGDGRYRIAVAPQIIDPNYPNDGKIWKEDFASFSGYLVVYLINKENNTQKVIECVVTDIKAHSYNTYPDRHSYNTGDVAKFDVENGIIQTGISYPNSSNASKSYSFAPANIDGSIIEFAGYALDFEPNDYKLDKIIVVSK